MADETNIFAEADARQKRFFEELAVSPIVEVFGVSGLTNRLNFFPVNQAITNKSDRQNKSGFDV